MPALGRAASLFHAIAPASARFVVGEGDDDDAVDSDGDEISLDAVVGQLLELIMTLTEHPRLCTVLEPALGEIVYQAIGYMCMTRARRTRGATIPINTSRTRTRTRRPLARCAVCCWTNSPIGSNSRR